MGKNGRGGGDVEREKAVRETNFKRSGMGKDRDHERKKERKKDRQDKKKGWNVGGYTNTRLKERTLPSPPFSPGSCHHHGNP